MSASRISRLWTVEDVSKYLGIPVPTLYQWRSKGYGPAGRRMGRYVRYRPEDVQSWVDRLSGDVA
ncbi:helix-turn-helix transcriptional regulator [Amycolatopsis sp. NPDC059021]|uniref:helix-turn-helix transcriptional regulator n=1 Tax=Amycolatopsis sp. NPDC059021 TaxID=3346704 RepID=UPI00366EEF22